VTQTAYTDGSLQGKRGGWAWLCGEQRDSGTIKTNDIYDAELMAICQCLEQAEGDVCIVTDHIGIANELRDEMGKNHHVKKAKEIWHRIHKVVDKLKGVEWMKRCTTWEMKEVDRMAYEARER
jgi:ribonuclease HI